MSKVAIIIAFKGFRDTEYFIPKGMLARLGVEIVTASNKQGLAIGADGGEMIVDILISSIKVDDFDAIVFVGGPGCLENLDNEESYRLARKAVSKNKILAAICVSPIILAKAGVLEEKKVTVWSSETNKEGVKVLEEKGAKHQPDALLVDGNIITANGPLAAYKFGDAILEALRKL